MPNTKILYLEAQKRNFIDRFLQNNPKDYWMRPEDGKITYNRRMAYNTPWAYHRSGPNMDCHFWHKILFDIIHGQQKIPIPCQSCWKVVVFPRDLEELFALHLLQKELDLPSKCGAEIWRVNSPRHYGGYFYNKSWEQGMEVYNLVKKTLEQDREWTGIVMGCPIKVRFNRNVIGYEGPIQLVLKRGCTEYEQNVGPSDRWTWDDDQHELEEIARDSFVQDIVNTRQTDRQRAEVFMKWIHGAYQIGDEKYKLFTNGNELFRKVLTYHDKDPEWVKAVLGGAKAKLCKCEEKTKIPVPEYRHVCACGKSFRTRRSLAGHKATCKSWLSFKLRKNRALEAKALADSLGKKTSTVMEAR